MERIRHESQCPYHDEKPSLPVDLEELTPSTTATTIPKSRLSTRTPLHTVSEDAAAAANRAERNMTLKESLHMYPAAILWSVALSTCLVMEGFDTILLANLFAYEPFQRTFGAEQEDGSYQLSASWQSALTNGALGGQILGLFAAGIVGERFGSRKTLAGALMLVAAFVTIVFCANNVHMLLIGECLLGLPWGVFQGLCAAYAVEVGPPALRGYLTTYINLCWVIGQLLASVVLRIMSTTRSDNWGYKIPFALQWFWPLFLIPLVLLAPESPWWCVRRGNYDDARHVLRRLRRDPHPSPTRAGSNPGEENNYETTNYNNVIEANLISMIQTDAKEKATQAGTSYLDCFRGVDRRRTEIACLCWTIQTLCGSTFVGYSTYFYESAGLSSSQAFTFSLIQFVLGIIGVVISWMLISQSGRRTIYLSGQLAMLICMLGIGILAFVSVDDEDSKVKEHCKASQWAIAGLLLLFTLIYDATVGPLAYTIVSESPSSRLRQKTIVLARNSYNISSIVTNIVTPWMLNPSGWNWGAKAGLFWAAAGAVGLCWSWNRLPEMRGRTFAELDVLFSARIPARYFKVTRVRVFGEGVRDRWRGLNGMGERTMDEAVTRRRESDWAGRRVSVVGARGITERFSF